MEIKRVNPSFQDKRGTIQDILINEPIEHITVITSKKDVTRGNHFHKKTIQWVYVHSGKLKSLTQKENENVVSRILEPGDLIKTEVLEKHALKILEYSIFYVFTKGPRGGDNYENDTYRLDKPLQDPSEKE
jgi:hypothetical protein